MISSLLSILNFAAMPLNIFIANARTAQQDEKVGCHFRSALLMSVLFAMAFSPFFAFSGTIYDAMGNDAGVGKAINDYCHGIIWTAGLVPMFTQSVLRRLFVGLQKTRVSLGMTVTYALLSIGLSFLASIYDPSPRGFGFASSVSAWLTCLAMFVYLALNKADFGSYQLFAKNVGPNSDCCHILKKGFLMAASPLIECLLFIIFSGLMGRESKVALEAFSVANQYARIVILGSFAAVASPLGTLMTRYKAASVLVLKNIYHAGLSLSVSLGLFVLIAALIATLSQSRYMIQPFVETTEEAKKETEFFNHLLLVIGVGGVLDGGVRIPSAGAIRPFNLDSRSFMINAFGLGFGFGLALLSHFLGLGPVVMTISLYVGIALAGGLQARDVYTAISKTLEQEQQPLIPSTTFLGNLDESKQVSHPGLAKH